MIDKIKLRELASDKIAEYNVMVDQLSSMGLTSQGSLEIEVCPTTILALLDENAALVECLKFYGDKNNWDERWTEQGDGGDISDVIQSDDVDWIHDQDGEIVLNIGGKRARELLFKLGVE